jgi:hypothetical protein
MKYRHTSGKTTLLTRTTFALVALVIIGCAVGYWQHSHKPALPKILVSSLSFPVYFPKPLPNNLNFSANSASVQANVLTFSLKDNHDKKVLVTQQARPNDFDFSRLSGNDEFTTPEGKAYIVDNDLRTTGSLVTDKTWVILNAPGKIDTDTLRQLIKNLTPIR